MSVLIPAVPQRGNFLLSSLTCAEYDALAPRLHRVELSMRQVVGEKNDKPLYVYFPLDCVCSVLATMSNGAAIEVGTIGNEGLVGVETMLGAERGTATTICQVAGHALRMRTSDFREALEGATPLRKAAQRFLLVYLALVSQSAACNRLHTIEERFARWVLMTHDRIKGDEVRLTQEFLAAMLGAHRPSVTLIAGAFQQAGLIRYRRGHMTILDRNGIEDASCECYATVSAEFRALLRGAQP